SKEATNASMADGGGDGGRCGGARGLRDRAPGTECPRAPRAGTTLRAVPGRRERLQELGGPAGQGRLHGRAVVGGAAPLRQRLRAVHVRQGAPGAVSSRPISRGSISLTN